MASQTTSSKPGRPRAPHHVAQPQSQIFRAEWDAEGVFFYQAYGDEIADHALRHGRLGGPSWGPSRMTWIKPSLAWMLYRSGYGHKPGQTRVLKVKLSHAAVAEVLRSCTLAAKSNRGDNSAETERPPPRDPSKVPGSHGRVQWDPERDLHASEGHEPRKLYRQRAIQIGVAHALSEFYVEQILSVEEVTALAHEVGRAHGYRAKKQKGEAEVKEAVAVLENRGLLPVEREYIPHCEEDVLRRLGIGIDQSD